MTKRFNRAASAAVTAAMLGSMVFSVIARADEVTEREYTYLLTMGTECQEYEEYEDNPCVEYWLSHIFDVDGEATKVSIDFSVLPSGSEKDNLNTLFATGEYMDIMAMDMASQTASQLYDEGVARDLTGFVEQYMPNYMAWAEAHPEYKLTNYVDGEERYIQLYFLSDAPEEPWGGFMYRRDWLLKYGTNPETGEAFTGGWNEDKTNWTDDVVFPSGGSDPVTISDWEWMLDIFQTALNTLGVEDGYAMQLPYTGYLGSGDLNTGFGGGTIGTYIGEDGLAVDGMCSDGARAYLKAMSAWYANGWIDPAFEERSGDMFFMIDMASIYTGKVGMWYGFNSESANLMDSGDELTDGICVYSAAQPINDMYGDESLQNVEPDCFYQQQLVTGSVIITDHVDDEELPALLTALDYNFSREGSLIHSFGLSDEMMAEFQAAVYLKLGLENGIYSLIDVDGVETVKVDKTYESVPTSGGLVGVNMVRVLGLAANANVDYSYTPVMEHNQEIWRTYTADAQVPITVSGQLTSEQSEEIAMINAALNPYVAQELPNFITGRSDIDDDEAWEEYCEQVWDYGSGKYAEYLNEVIRPE